MDDSAKKLVACRVENGARGPRYIPQLGYVVARKSSRAHNVDALVSAVEALERTALVAAVILALEDGCVDLSATREAADRLDAAIRRAAVARMLLLEQARGCKSAKEGAGWPLKLRSAVGAVLHTPPDENESAMNDLRDAYAASFPSRLTDGGPS